MATQGAFQQPTAAAELVQEPLYDLPGRLWDVLIVGAGPAGCAAAFHLASRGHEVLLTDRVPFPREKACGDNILPDAMAALRRMGVCEEVREAGHIIGEASIFSPSHTEVTIPGEYLTIRRRLLDFILARRAVEAGTTFALGKVGSFRTEGDGTVSVWSRGPAAVGRARIVILATGAKGVPASRDASARWSRRLPQAVAVRCYVRSPAPLERMVVWYGRSLLPGYGWIFPMGDGLYNAGCGLFEPRRRGRRINLADAFRRFTRDLPEVRSVFEQGEPVSPLNGSPLRCGLVEGRPLGPGRVLSVGDALGCTYPLTGEGIGKAMETGELAAQIAHRALENGDFGELHRYSQAVDSLRRCYRGYEVAQRWMRRPWLNDFLASRIRKSPYLRSAAARMLREEADPREIFSLMGVLRSFVY